MTGAVGGEVHTQERTTDAPAAARTFGALATQLDEALRHVRQAIEPHAALLGDGIPAELDALRAEFAKRRVRIALYGEVKAGKSTLLNAVAGAALSPVAFEPLTSVPVRVTYGPQTTWRVGEQQLDSVADLDHVMREGVLEADAPHGPEVVVETNLDLLELGGQVDLLDTPGVGSAPQFDALSAETLRALDAVVLVVRYPALFTEFTRRLMDGLQTDIGKLFVVWNLDADCAELTAEERARHAETLRTNVAGAHELFLVDARAGFRAMQADDANGSIASGLTALIASLRRFAASGGREVAALREAAKRAQRALEAAQRRLSARHTELDRALADTRARLQAVRSKADADAATARARLAAFEDAVTRIAQQASANASKLAGDLRQRLHTARRRWVRQAAIDGLAAAVAAATTQYADALRTVNQATIQSLQAEMQRFGTSATVAARERTEIGVGQLAPEERVALATLGRMQLLRRALWHRWYLPGLAALDAAGVSNDLAAQTGWLSTTVQAVRDAAGATLGRQLAAITQRTEAEAQGIQLETNFDANRAEFEQLGEHVPIVTTQSEAVRQLARDARTLL